MMVNKFGFFQHFLHLNAHKISKPEIFGIHACLYFRLLDQFAQRYAGVNKCSVTLHTSIVHVSSHNAKMQPHSFLSCFLCHFDGLFVLKQNLCDNL